MSTTTDKIVSAGIELGEQIAGNISNWQAQEQTLRDLIAAALADARREGAEQMREKYNAMRQALEVIAVGDSNAPASDAADTLVACDEWQAGSLAAARADGSMPLPTGERQAVLLTDEQVAAIVAQHWGCADIAPQSVCGFARSIEAAALSANNLEVRRG